MRSIYLQIIDHQSDNELPVLATVALTEGSTPQKPGSSALFNDKGLIAGTVGGGVVEGRIQKFAAERFISKKSGWFNFNLHNDISKKEEAICGGKISILVDAAPEKNLDVFRKVGNSINANIPGIIVTFVTNASENEAEIKRYWYDGSEDHGIPGNLWPKISNEASELLSSANPMNFREIDLSGKKDDLSSFVLLEPVLPPLKLIIAGAGHIGRSLAHTGSLLGFEVTVIDDRPEYACHENIPDASHIIVEDIGKAVMELRKGSDTYLVIVTRGHKDDASALKEAIGSDLAYIGMIGSRKKTGSMKTEFIQQGWATTEMWDDVYTPIGLEIHAQTVEEIAISIAAQLIQVKNSKTGKRKSCPA